MLACQAYGALALQPEMASLRGVPGGEVRFQLLHKRSVRLNGFTLLAGVGLLAATGFIVERK